MPKELEPGVLYVSKEFNTAAHLCLCGCGSKVRTPLTPTEWSLTVSECGPTLYPSIGNWQLPCKSHYLITDGDVIWANQWTNAQIANGRRQEDLHRKVYFKRMQNKQESFVSNLWRKIKNLFD
jgi:hypothetical protein